MDEWLVVPRVQVVSGEWVLNLVLGVRGAIGDANAGATLISGKMGTSAPTHARCV